MGHPLDGPAYLAAHKARPMSALHPHPHHSEAGWDVPERNCRAESCGQRFKPEHPRQMYCHGPSCPGPPRPVRTRRRTGTGPARNRADRAPAAEARAIAVKGFLADVLLGIHHAPADRSVPEILDEYMAAAMAGRTQDMRDLAVGLCSMVAARYFTDASAPE